MNPGAMKTNEMKNRATNEPLIWPVADALTPVESEDLPRFEGEGGPEAPVPELAALSRGIEAQHETHDPSPKDKPTKSSTVAGSDLLQHRASCGELKPKRRKP